MGVKRTVTRKVKQAVSATLAMPTEFVAQNGAVIHQTTKISVTGCPPTRGKVKTAKKKRKKGRK